MAKMNPLRAKIMAEIFGLLHDGDRTAYKVVAAAKLNQEFVDRGRGHGRSQAFIKQVAGARDNTTYFPPNKRNGAKERARRLAQR